MRRLLGFVAALLILSGCATRQATPAADTNATALEYSGGGAKFTYAKDEDLARRGFPKARLKIAFLAALWQSPGR